MALIITVDGLSGSGKGTLAADLGRYTNLPVLETGLLWRKVAAFMFINDVVQTDEATLTVAHNLEYVPDYDEDLLRSNEISTIASIVSGFREARSVLDDYIVNWINRPEGGILDGRECGISMAPNADHKFFLIATPEARAKRRSAQHNLDYKKTLLNIIDRDSREISRPVAPSVPAKDAIILDTTRADAAEILRLAIYHMEGQKLWADIRYKAF